MRRIPFVAFALAASVTNSEADDSPAVKRQRAMEFQLRAQERTGVLLPLYVYPKDVENNPAFNRVIEAKRTYPTVPMWVIVNPASGPGERIDPNYTRAVDRLRGAGCVTLGYVTTSYAKRTPTQVRAEVERWAKLYPRVQGIFFDEMIYEDTEAGAQYQAGLNCYAHEAGFWPTVANPGADTPGRYFASDAADTIVVHEGNGWPTETRLKGATVGGYADHPPFTRGILLHTQAKLDKTALRTARKYVRWVYVTEAPFRPNDPQAANPWEHVSKHLEDLCAELSQP